MAIARVARERYFECFSRKEWQTARVAREGKFRCFFKKMRLSKDNWECFVYPNPEIPYAGIAGFFLWAGVGLAVYFRVGSLGRRYRVGDELSGCGGIGLGQGKTGKTGGGEGARFPMVAGAVVRGGAAGDVCRGGASAMVSGDRAGDH